MTLKYQIFASASLMILILSGCGNQSESVLVDANASEAITFHGKSYGSVVSPYTGKTWLDRNLGAKQVCTAYNDPACYGDYYQWGRSNDGHQESNSTLTLTQATDINNVGISFINSSDPYDYDWAHDADIDGSLRIENWAKTDGTTICPVSYRVPNRTEIEDETINASDKLVTSADAFNNFLKLPSAGIRSFYDGVVSEAGNHGFLWTNSASGSISNFLRFIAGTSGTGNNLRANGLPVRCIKD